MRVFYAEFKGHYPVGALIIAVSPTKKIAMNKINNKLKDLSFIPIKIESITEIPTKRAYAEILLNGEY